jgi:hypothetical protein
VLDVIRMLGVLNKIGMNVENEMIKGREKGNG